MGAQYRQFPVSVYEKDLVVILIHKLSILATPGPRHGSPFESHVLLPETFAGVVDLICYEAEARMPPDTILKMCRPFERYQRYPIIVISQSHL